MASEMPLPHDQTQPGANASTTGAATDHGATASRGGNGVAGAGAAGRDPRLERMVSSAHEAVDTAAEAMQLAADRMRTQARRVSDFEEEFAESCRTRVRENPLSYLAGAVLLGVLVGRLSR